jgi:hypothetical protein
MTDAAVIFFENALVHLLKESTEIRIIVVIGHQMSVDDLLRMSPLFWLLPPIFNTHLTPDLLVGFQVSGGHPSSWNLGFWIFGEHPNFSEKVGCWVSLGCNALATAPAPRHM